MAEGPEIGAVWLAGEESDDAYDLSSGNEDEAELEASRVALSERTIESYLSSRW